MFLPRRSVVLLIFILGALASCSADPPLVVTSASRAAAADDLTTPSVPIGTLTGSTGVTQNGAATVRFDIDVPPGRARMEPSLAVGYSSSNGNGPLGVGFSLEGFPTITRCPMESLHPGVQRAHGVDLCFGGRLLLVEGEHAEAGAVYRVEGAPDLRVDIANLPDANSDGGPLGTSNQLRVSYPSGRVGYFGVIDDDTVGPWRIERLEDRFGNRIVYEYTTSGDGDEVLPSRILYTLSTVTSSAYPMADWGENEIRFGYEERPAEDNYLAYSSLGRGARGVHRRLTTIRTFARDALVSEYRLDYVNESGTKRSQLEWIKKCDAAGVCLPRTDFVWTLGGTGYEVHELPAAAAMTAPDFKSIATSTTLDVDHDGRLELLFAYDSRADSPSARWLMWDPETGIDELPIPALFVEGNAALAPVAADFDGDGVTDLIAPFCADGHCNDDAIANIEYPFADRVAVIFGRPDDADGLAATTSSLVLESDLRILIAAVAQIDGDGYPDMFVCGRDVSGEGEHGYWQLAMNRPVGGVGPQRELVLYPTQRHCVASELYEIMDSDGNARDELWVLGGNFNRPHPGSYQLVEPDYDLGSGAYFGATYYAGLELPVRDATGALTSIDDALALVAVEAVWPTQWPGSGIKDYTLGVDFSQRILQTCWKPEENDQLPPLLADQVTAGIGSGFAGLVAGAFHVPSNPFESGTIPSWVGGGDFVGFNAPDAPSRVPANVPYVHAGAGPDRHVDLNGDGLVDIVRVVVSEPGSADEAQVYKQMAGGEPAYCRVDDTFDFGLGLWINTGAGFERSGTIKLLSNQEPWRAAQMLSRVSALDMNGDGRTDFLSPDFNLYQNLGTIDQWTVLRAESTGDPSEPLTYVPHNLLVSVPWYDSSFEWSDVTSTHLAALIRRLGVAHPAELVTDEYPDVVSRAATGIHLNGNRLHDIIFFTGSEAATDVLALARASNHADYLLTVVDGLGAMTKFEYVPGYDTDVYTSGEATETAVPVTPRMLVRERQEDLGLSEPGFLHYRYTYSGALADRRGLGALGVASRRERVFGEGETLAHQVTWTEANRSSDYDVALASYPYRGRATRSVTETRYDSEGTERRLVREVETDWQAIPAAHDNYATSTASRATRVYDFADTYCFGFPCAQSTLEGMVPRESTTYQVLARDELGEVTHSFTETGDGQRNTQERAFTHSGGNFDEPYLIGLLTSDATTAESPGGTSHRHSTYEHDPATGALRFATREPDDPSGEVYRRTEYRYDVRGNVHATIVNASGSNRVSMSDYDPAGYFLTRATNAVGHSTTRRYHTGFGVPIQTTDPNGVVAETCLDGFGRATCARTRSAIGGPTTGAEITHVIEAPQPVIGGAAYRVSTRRNGIETLGVAYDRRGRERRQVRSVIDGDDEDGSQYQRITLYDDRFQTASVSIPLPLDWVGVEPPGTRYHRDATGRVVSQVDVSGAEQTTVYDGLETTRSDADGNVTRSRTDEQGRVVWSERGDIVTCFEYGPFGDLQRTRRNCGNTGGDPESTSTMLRDPYNRIVYVDDPDAGARLYAYNGYDEVEIATDALGKQTFFDYDKISRMRERTSDDGVANWYYDDHPNGIGKLSRTTNEDGIIARSYYYDDFGRPNWNGTHVGKNTFAVGHVYANGLLTELLYPAPSAEGGAEPYRIRYEYDDYGNLRFIYDVRTGQPLWEVKDMDGWGHVTREQHTRNDFETQRHYFPTGRPMQLSVYDEVGDPVVSQAFGWTAAGNLDYRTDALAGSTRHYAYDEAGQVMEETTAGVGVTMALAYDALGNIENKTGVGAYWYSPDTGRLDQAGGESFSYDANGNLRTRTGPAGTSFYRWTELGKLARVDGDLGSALFRYDADGTEVVKYVGKRKVTSVDGLYEHVLDGALTSHRYLIHAYGKPVMQVTAAVGRGVTWTTRYLHSDYLGSPVASSDAAGKADTTAYDPWGAAIPAVTDMFTESWLSVGFTGHDPELVAGMIDMGARYYDPRLGRFHSPDSVVTSPLNGLDWNRYAYVRNNPLRYNDPTGHSPQGGLKEEPKDGGDDGTSPSGSCNGIPAEYCPPIWWAGEAPEGTESQPTDGGGMDSDERTGQDSGGAAESDGTAEMAAVALADAKMASAHFEGMLLASQNKVDALQYALDVMLWRPAVVDDDVTISYDVKSKKIPLITVPGVVTVGVRARSEIGVDGTPKVMTVVEAETPVVTAKVQVNIVSGYFNFVHSMGMWPFPPPVNDAAGKAISGVARFTVNRFDEAWSFPVGQAAADAVPTAP